MKRLSAFLTLFCLTGFLYAQTAADIYKGSDIPVFWMGLDFSHVKLIGDFSNFKDAGYKGPQELKDVYFPSWNRVVFSEQDKYDVKNIFRTPNLKYDLVDIMDENSRTSLVEIEAYNNPDYEEADLKEFVHDYKMTGKKGLGVLFLVEALNKAQQMAVFHVLVINMSTKEILISERVVGKPGGFGIRNYWAGAIDEAITISKNSFYKWKEKYAK